MEIENTDPSKVCVGIRVRPFLGREDGEKVCIQHPLEHQIQLSNTHTFTFDHVFDMHTTQQGTIIIILQIKKTK